MLSGAKLPTPKRVSTQRLRSALGLLLCACAGALFLSSGVASAGVSLPRPPALPDREARLHDMASVGHAATTNHITGFNALSAPCPAWTAAQSPNDGGGSNVLYGISAASPTDIWAVGYSAAGDVFRTLAMHWDGQNWTLVASPNPGAGSNYFDSVVAISANDAWAVGNSGPDNQPIPFIVHWDGHAWTPSRLPNLDPSGNELYAMSAGSSNDVWAVGSIGCQKCKTEHALIMHYNGVDWSVTPQDAGGYADALYGVIAFAADNVWAAGYHYEDSGAQPLAEHWDGHAWAVASLPHRGGRSNFLNAIWGSSATDVWAVGATFNGQHNDIIFEHWDGNYWSHVDVANPSAEGTDLYAITGTAPGNVWATGYFIASGVRHALIMQYNGSNWTQYTATDAGPGADLFAASAAPGGDPVAAGYVGGSNARTLIERYADACAPPPATPTSPPAPPTATNTPAPVPTLPIPGSGSRTFPETGKTLSGLFFGYWDNNGGLAQQGYPISTVMGELSDLDHKPYTVQYFERAVFEYHPENQAPYDVLLSQLGTFQYKKKYPTGAPGQQANSTGGSVLFPETGKRVGGKFLDYWKSHGGLAQQGYPISEEFTEVSDLNGKPYTVQYFERAVFELHPENQAPYDVLLSQLGTFQYKLKYQGR